MAAGEPSPAPPLVLVGPLGWGDALHAGLPPAPSSPPGTSPNPTLARVVAGAAAVVVPPRSRGLRSPPSRPWPAGAPVVASDLLALREALGDQAELCNFPGDLAALAAALARPTTRAASRRGPPRQGGRLHLGDLCPGDPNGLPAGPGVPAVTTTPPGEGPAAAPGERRPGLGGPLVGVVAEQLLRPVPGGVGRYVQALARHLPVEAAVDRAGRWSSSSPATRTRLAAAGPPVAATRRLGRLVTRTWVTMRRPGLPAESCSTASTWSTRPAPPCPDGARRPLVATVHDLAFRHFPEAYPPAGRRYHERSARIVADEAARVLVPSEATARDLAELYGVDRGRVTITPLGVEVPAEPDRAGAERLLRDLGVRGRFLLAVGTLEPRKNLPRLLDAFGEVTDELPGHWLVVVGPVGWGRGCGPPGTRSGSSWPARSATPSSTPSTRPPTAWPTRACTRASAWPARGHGQRHPGADQRPLQPARGRRRRRPAGRPARPVGHRRRPGPAGRRRGAAPHGWSRPAAAAPPASPGGPPPGPPTARSRSAT